jgi:hypothetical protein
MENHEKKVVEDDEKYLYEWFIRWIDKSNEIIHQNLLETYIQNVVE